MHEIEIHTWLWTFRQKQQNKKSNDNSNFPIGAWKQSQLFTVCVHGGNTQRWQRKNRLYLWNKSELSEIHYVYVSPCRGFSVSFFLSLLSSLSLDVQKFCVTCLKFTKHVLVGWSSFFSRSSAGWGFYLEIGAAERAGEYMWWRHQTFRKSDLNNRHIYFVVSLFRTSLHILDCNSRLSALIMRRHIRSHSIHFDHDLLPAPTDFHSFAHTPHENQQQPTHLMVKNFSKKIQFNPSRLSTRKWNSKHFKMNTEQPNNRFKSFRVNCFDCNRPFFGSRK